MAKSKRLGKATDKDYLDEWRKYVDSFKYKGFDLYYDEIEFKNYESVYKEFFKISSPSCL